MPYQRPYFISSFLSAFRQQGPTLQANSQPNKHQSSAVTSSPATTTSYSQASAQQASSRASPTGVSIHSPRGAGASASGVPIPGTSASGRRRGSDSSSEGFRDVIGSEKWYIGGRTAGGEERFFKLGVVRRVRSNDGLSLDRLSL
ncbi:hypothetical protein E4U42_000709 [Claviceps africana]|uniref:Uncharacterized protein n=1 Tax=Claviceps africana TaxID=83212 RepID=A0A8K0JG03_9HYPO|nr:hypothetical protein E4U42_000709 [Claviceps africana]